VNPSSSATIAGHERSVRKIAPLMNPCVIESPIVTRRCRGRLLRATATGMPRVGSRSGARGSVWISSSAGVSLSHGRAIGCPPRVGRPPGSVAAEQSGLAGIGASDAHMVAMVGLAWTRFAGCTPPELRVAMGRFGFDSAVAGGVSAGSPRRSSPAHDGGGGAQAQESSDQPASAPPAGRGTGRRCGRAASGPGCGEPPPDSSSRSVMQTAMPPMLPICRSRMAGPAPAAWPPR
jgi:hypothetical protein